MPVQSSNHEQPRWPALRWLCWTLIAVFCLSLGLAQAAAPSDWISGPGYRFRHLAVPATGRVHLTEVPASETGITFRYQVSEERGEENTIRRGGTGVAAGDIDGDGRCDLFFCSMGGKSALYRNLGNWRFEDITEQAGVACSGQDSTGAVFADVDGDGDLDLLINSIGGGTRLFLNDGKGHFTECTDCGLIRKHGSTSLALADIDGNGTLDLYVANFATTKIEDRPNVRIQTTVVNGKTQLASIDGLPLTSPELTNRYYIDPADHTIRERGEADLLYLNDGHGRFKAVSWTGGTFLNSDGTPLPVPPYDWGLSVMFRDLNGDGAPDIYVCNDLFTPDRIWINDGRGHFKILSSLAVRQTSLFSMGVDFADINRDGYDDFVVVDMLTPSLPQQKVEIVGVKYGVLPVGQFENRPQYKRNTLFLNRGDATFAQISQLSGVEATGWSWAPVFLDVDLDGFEDLLVTAGYNRDSLNVDAINRMRALRGNRKLTEQQFRDLKKLFPELPQTNRAFRNRGDLTFEDKAHEWGFDYVGISQGICLADLDNDGDLDVVVVRQNAPVGIYRNETAAPRVAVRLKGNAPNTRGIGSKIKFLGGPVPQSQEMICGGRYLSGDDNLRVFAAGNSTNGLSIEVLWRSGLRSGVTNVQPNCLYEVDERGAAPLPPGAAPVTKTWFSDASNSLNHHHTDLVFDDFSRQPTLPRKLSQSGPGVTWFDLDGDGWEDLILGSGNGGALSVYHNAGNGTFTTLSGTALNQATSRDYTTVLGFKAGAGNPVLVAGLANYEDGLTNGSMLLAYDALTNAVTQETPARPFSIGPLALGDILGRGEMALFVGGRVVPGHYPQATSSLLFRTRAGRFTLDEQNSAQFSSVGLVSGAVFSDLDGDGYPDLILACDWGPLRVFHNDHGKLVEMTEQLGLSSYQGWWNGVTVGDFDGDGKMDIVASNWGRNTKYQTQAGPIRIFYGQANDTGLFAAVESSYDAGQKKWLAWCGLSSLEKLLPHLRNTFPTFEAYGLASVPELFAGHVNSTNSLEANWLESTLFLNRGDHFEAKPLPIEAQFSPAFGISVADFDGDGLEDIFMSQNFAATDAETPRYDAGRGLLLKGDGHGGFTSVPGQTSGIMVYGDQRGCAVADYDGDGRVDLVVTQNGAMTKLYHNVTATPGLRIRLSDSGGGVGFGATLRLIANGRMGPAREIHAGSGYWSQDGAVQVMNAKPAADHLWVRWPGGKVTVSTIPPGAAEVLVSADGSVRKLR